MKSRNLKLLETSGPLQACTGIALPVHIGTKNVLIQSVDCKTEHTTKLLCPTAEIRSESGTSQALPRASVWPTGMMMTLLHGCSPFVSHYVRCDLQTVSPRTVPTLTHRPDFYCQMNTGNSEALCGYAQSH
jgi:hypothetical protein